MIIDCHNHIGVEPTFYTNGFYPYAQDVETLCRVGGALGVDRWVVFPFVGYRGLELNGQCCWPAPEGDPGVPYAFENRRHLEEMNLIFPEQGRKYVHFVMLDPSRNQTGQAAALRELREEFPFHGLKIQATVIQSPIRELLTKGACLLDLAEEWSLPILIHSSILPSDDWSQASDILDVAEGRPNLHFCLAHSCRFDKASLDRLAELPNAWFDCSAHIIHCKLAVAGGGSVATPENRFPSDYRSPEQVLADLAAAYPSKLMWGSDRFPLPKLGHHRKKQPATPIRHLESVRKAGKMANAWERGPQDHNIRTWGGLIFRPEALLLCKNGVSGHGPPSRPQDRRSIVVFRRGC